MSIYETCWALHLMSRIPLELLIASYPVFSVFAGMALRMYQKRSKRIVKVACFKKCKKTLVNEVLLQGLVIVNYNLELALVFNDKFWKQSSQNTLLIDLHLFFNKYILCPVFTIIKPILNNRMVCLENSNVCQSVQVCNKSNPNFEFH